MTNDNPFSLQGRVILVTGCARGLGQAMARALARAGAHVVLNDIDEPALDIEVAALGEAGLSASGVVFDVADEAAGIDAVATIVSTHGRLDALFNNAGVGNRTPTVDLALDNWRNVIDVDLTAGFQLAREAVKPMLDGGGGQIINTVSVAGVLGQEGLAHYVAAKSGLIGLTKALAVEFGPHGITCNAIAPGYFTTSVPFPSASAAAEASETERRRRVRERIPLRRFAEPDELGGIAVFLASAASSYITGQVLCVDGGITVAL